MTIGNHNDHKGDYNDNYNVDDDDDDGDNNIFISFIVVSLFFSVLLVL